MIERISVLLSDISIYIIALPLALGLWRYARLNATQKAVFAIVLLSILVEGITYVSYKNEIAAIQQLAYYGFTFLEFCLLVYVFRATISRFVAFSLSALLLAVVLMDLIWWSGVNQFNGYSTAIEALLVIGLAINYFHRTLRELKVRHLDREPLFWVSTGVLLYFASNLFIFLYTNHVSAATRTLFIIWGIHAIFNALHYIFYSLALWVNPRE